MCLQYRIADCGLSGARGVMRVKRCQVSGIRCRVSACIPPIPEKKLQHSKFLSHSLEILVVQKIQIQGEEILVIPKMPES